MNDDAAWMARALFVAERGRGRTTPNPLVGAVVVSPEGIVVGQGAHLAAGGPHAEVHALRAAGDAARGATLYCTLEPCCHTGRTGPCTEAVIRAGITRVVTAVEDPNPRVAGGGHALLRAAGIAVTTGIGRDEALGQNAPFFTWITQRRPWTVLKTAASADGFVSGAPGLKPRGSMSSGAELAHGAQGLQPLRITGPATDRWMHRQRAWIDAIAVGADTAIADNPLLTARGAWRARPLTRVIIDWRGRVSPDARVYSTQSAGPVIMVGLDSVSAAHLDALRRQGVIVELFADRNLAAVAERLAQREVQSLLVEGGPALQAAWIDAGQVDAVQYVETPLVLGAGTPVSPALRAWVTKPAPRHLTVLGADRLVEGTWA
jgi:diaminohydroxyphosphoribosylaminopyrimidine deaminase/5-amino-6-(5-phosphoribosylamino)uracil reductase